MYLLEEKQYTKRAIRFEEMVIELMSPLLKELIDDGARIREVEQVMMFSCGLALLKVCAESFKRRYESAIDREMDSRTKRDDG